LSRNTIFLSEWVSRTAWGPLFLAIAVVGDPARADQVIAGGRSYPGARILGLQAGQLQIKTAEGVSTDIPLGEIELIVVDRIGQLDDLTEAERLVAAGEVQKAVTRYERALRVASGFWADVVCSRLILAHDRLRQLDEAVHYFALLAQSRTGGASAAADLIPQMAPAQRNARFARAIRELDAALSLPLPADQAALLALVRYDLFRRADDRRAFEAAAEAISVEIPSSIRTRQVYAIVNRALESSLQAAPTEHAMDALDRAIEKCPDANLPDMLLLKGRVLMKSAVTRDEIIRASWPFMRVAVHMPADKRAAEGLLGAAQALDRLGQKSKAREMLAECVGHAQVDPTVRAEAERLLNGSAPSVKPD